MRSAQGALCAALVLLPATALAGKEWEPTFSRYRATKILRELHRFHAEQIEAAQRAQKGATNREVEALAARFSAEHRKLDDRVRAWAEHHHLSIATERVPSDEQRELDERGYLIQTIAEGQRWIPVLERESDQIRYKALSYFLADIAKSLKQQQRAAQDLEQRLRQEG